MEIKELVELCKRGEEQALGVLYKTYSGKMLGICLRYIPNRDIAEDLLHDGFIVIFTSIQSLRDPERLEIWMGKIMKNIALRYLNQNNLVPTVPLAELVEDELPPDDSFSLDYVPYDKLLAMIDKLPEGYRNIFKLSVFEGLSHKEIALLLNIAPHSSSSQLSRAKGLLKKMIAEYKTSVILFFLAFLPFLCGYLFRHSKTPEKKLQDGAEERIVASVKQGIPSHPVSSLSPVMPLGPALPSETMGRAEMETTLLLSPDSLITAVTPDVESEDTIITLQPSINPYLSEISLPKFNHPSASAHSKWKLMLLGSIGSQIARSLSKWIATPQGDGIAAGFPEQVNTWEEYYTYLNARAEAGLPGDSVTLVEVAENNSGPIVERQHHYAPVTIGFSLNKKINDRWNMETGLQYTYLKSTFTLGNKFSIQETQKLHYIGVPLKVSYRLANYKNFSVYSMAGLQVDIPLKGTLNTCHEMDSVSISVKHQSLDMPWQWSVSGGVGVQYHFSPAVSLYAEPGIHYYIPDGSSLRTIRKEHPITFSVPVGVRISW